MDAREYWQECIASSAEECGVALTQEQRDSIAECVQGAHENYSLAFYRPSGKDPAIDEWQRKYERLECEFRNYRTSAETAVVRSLHLKHDSWVSIKRNGEIEIQYR